MSWIARMRAGAAASAILTLFAPAAALAADAREGKAVALNVCDACHVVADDQPFAPALNVPGPPFRQIARQPGLTAAELAASVRNRHPLAPTPSAMPNPDITPKQLADVVAYILSLRERRAGGAGHRRADPSAPSAFADEWRFR